MSVNVLGPRKVWRIAAATHLPVLRAWVRSHDECGRWAYLTVGWDAKHRYHRHAWYDRWDGSLQFAPNGAHNSSCHGLFPRETPPNIRTEALATLAGLIEALDGAW